MKIKKFTLIELLIVLVIIMILLSLLIPALTRAREKSRRVVCLNNQSQVYKGTILYATSNKYSIPLGWTLAGKSRAYLIRYQTKEINFGLLPIVRNGNILWCPSQNYQPLAENGSGNEGEWGGSGIWRASFNVNPLQKVNSGTGLADVGGYKKLNDFADQAFLIDVYHQLKYSSQSHRDGYNSIYADGAGRYIMKKDLDHVLDPLFASPTSSSLNDAFWEALTEQF